ncbi:hypothetical protein PL373_14735 [Tenacibaculum maritimum]|nr:hypothetical protein [Tenacibaculum maritimum]
MKKPKQKAITGTIWQNVIMSTLTMILILLPQQIFSQKVNINQEKQTVTLNKEKTIDVAKIIKNEKRLTEDNTKLVEIIRKQDSTIQSLANKNLLGLETVKLQNSQIFKLSQDVQRYSSMQLNYEEKKKYKPTFLFIKFRADYLHTTKQYLPSTGIIYFGKKIGAGINIGFFENQITYGAEIAINIF